jgi:hypothetical protein
MGIRVVNQTALGVGHGVLLPPRFWARRGWKHKAPLLAALIATSAGAQDIRAIVGGASASAVLRQWCAARHLSALTARRERGPVKAADASALVALAVRPGQEVRYRRVALGCGGLVLSRADNWYLPGRLTPEMNRRLDTTDAPFGLVVAPLHFRRATLRASARQVRAVLLKPNGTPFSYVIEDYASPPSP